MQMSLDKLERTAEEREQLPALQSFEHWFLETIVTPYGSRLHP
jgi:hypothetical protein